MGEINTVRIALAQTELRWHVSPEDFHDHMERLVQGAAEQAADIVVFPEDVGLPLAVTDDLGVIQGAQSLSQASARLAAHRQSEIAPLMRRHGVGALRAYLTWRAPWMAEVYGSTFASLARRYEVVVVAGSLPLAEPGADDGRIYNTSHIYGRDGELLGRQRKVHLMDIESEGLGLCGALPEEYSVVCADGVVLGVGICLDCFDPELIARLARQGMQILCDVKANPKEFTFEEQSENRKSSWSRCQEWPIYAAQVFGVGNLLGLPFRGRSAVYCNTRLTPDGSGVLALAQSDDAEELLVADLDLSRPAGLPT